VGSRENGQEEAQDRRNRCEDAALVAQTFRAAADVAQAPTDGKPGKKDDEKLSIFWRVFGGTILSIGALVVVTLFNNLTSTLSDLRAEINKANEARAQAVAEMVRKEEFNSRMTSNWDRMQTLQKQNTDQTAALTSLKTDLDAVKDRLSRQTTDGESLKKDLAALEVMKERVAGLAQDMKGSRDDILKLRADVDKNQSYDLERRDRRDAQYKQIDEAQKELQKGLQDCREKLARLEGQYGPPSPAAPKKANNTRPATPAPKDPPETTPPPSSPAPTIPPSKGDD
jgi:uncharacterized phage infection (PIP) family protein YhgE